MSGVWQKLFVLGLYQYRGLYRHESASAWFTELPWLRLGPSEYLTVSVSNGNRRSGGGHVPVPTLPSPHGEPGPAATALSHQLLWL